MKYEDCPLCGMWDCECEDILSPEEYKRLVEEEVNISKKFFNK